MDVVKGHVSAHCTPFRS